MSVQSPGCLILLIDESAAMEAPVQEDVDQSSGQTAKSKSVACATAVNSLLKQLAAGPDFDVALVGYQANAAGEVQVGSRWAGGADFLPVSTFSTQPVKVETRTRRVPNPGGIGTREEPVDFPIWYVPTLGAKAPQIAAFEHCRNLLTTWRDAAGPGPGVPLVLHLCGGGSGDGNPARVIGEIQKLEFANGSPLVFQAHLSTSKTVPPTLYPSARAYLPAGPIRDLFDRCSQLTEPQIAALKAMKVTVLPKSRGMLYNGKMIDVVRFLGLAKTHAKDWPARVAAAPAAPAPVAAAPAAAPVPPPELAPPEPLPPFDADPEPVAELDLTIPDTPAAPALTEKAGLLVFLLDRSVQDPFAADAKNACARLQEQLNDMLQKIGKQGEGKLDVAVISYGVDGIGEVEVRTTLEGPLAGQALIRDTELAAGALRIDEIETQLPNGVGGLMTVNLKKQIFVELDPTAAAPPTPGFQAVRDVVGQWAGQHPQSCLAPLVVHLTRAAADAAALDAAVAELASATTPAGPVALYHLVATEAPHKSLAYLSSSADLGTPELQKHWDVTSPLLGRADLAVSKPTVNPESRGFVLNGKFDLLLDGVKQVLS